MSWNKLDLQMMKRIRHKAGQAKSNTHLKVKHEIFKMLRHLQQEFMPTVYTLSFLHLDVIAF